MDEKTKMLLDAQEHPEQFTDEALHHMQDNSEIRVLMEATAQGKRALMKHQPVASQEAIDAAWQEFEAKHFPKAAKVSILQKVAASFIGLLFISCIAFAAVHIVRNVIEKDTKAPVQETEISDSHQPVISADTIKSDTIIMATPVIFDNVTLDSIAKDIAAYHHIGMDLQNDQAKQLRFYFVWKRNDSLQEVVEKLNVFEHVNMAVEDGKLIIR